MALDSVVLSGEWEFRIDSQAEWLPVTVPGCWEQIGVPHDREGPGWYRKVIAIPADWTESRDTRLWLRFGAVSYACQVTVNGSAVGEHIGAWDAFTFEITEAVGESMRAEILVRVVKPGGLSYPTKQTTAGFLPYVWGYLFGGIWQEVRLELTGSESVDGEGLARQTRKREVGRSGAPLTLNGKPFYPRMALSWGWYPGTLHCNPPVAVMQAELENLRALGYNGVKCCLWVPPPAYLDLCDAMGILVWLELPLWLPEMDAAQLEQVRREYEAIVLQLRHHPCIVVWSLGCELSATCPAEFLKTLYHRIRSLTEGTLLRDNSGGGECYGGQLVEYADYYDYHFYCDLPFLRNTFDYFLPRWRPDQPWLFGEFCDADAFRDLPALKAAHGGELPWWAVDDPKRNPQGVRWDMNIVGEWANLEKHGLLERREELKEGQRRQTLLHRKYTVELVRTYREMSGYVITGLRDTPISTAGMFDDFGDFRYSPEEFTCFNADTVLFLGWHRRRNWIAGGDRPSYIDHWTHTSGETILPRLGISHYGPTCSPLSGQITVMDTGGECLSETALQNLPHSLKSGTVEQLTVVELVLPEVTCMTRLTLRATLRLDDTETVQNEWPLWAVPKTDWKTLPPFAAFDPDSRLTGLERYGAEWKRCQAQTIDTLGTEDLLVASRWTEEIGAFAERGGRAFVFVDSGGGLPTEACPFWRETMKLFDPHPLWEQFPHEGFTDINFFGLGPDCALLPDALASLFPQAVYRPLLRRVDARTCGVSDYLAEVLFPTGGKLLLTTLRLHGGLGDQPDGLLRHTAGRHLLVEVLHLLSER